MNVGNGRRDILISPKNEHHFGAVIEIKQLKGKRSSSRMKELSEKAICQINEQNYAKELLRRHASPIFLYGITFFP